MRVSGTNSGVVSTEREGKRGGDRKWTHTRWKRFGKEHEETKALQMMKKEVSLEVFKRP